MSAADVELLRTNLASLAEEGYEVLLPLVHPDFEMETLPGQAAEPQVYRGVDGMRRWWESFYEFMDEVRIEPLEYHDAGEGMVMMEAMLHARGKASGVEASQRAFLLCTSVDGLLTRIDFFESVDDGLAAAAARATA
jgi:ketosteroid isomerase-like protein